MNNKSYSELILLPSIEERIEYLMLYGRVGEETFGFKRYLNQVLYKSDEWLEVRDNIIIRDKGLDLGVEGYEIQNRIMIHHINPITKEDIINRSRKLFDPENLITTCKKTHDIIHYASRFDRNSYELIERAANDTCPWLH